MSPAAADLGLIYCAAVWGATFYMVKDALAGVDPVAMVAHRFLLSALFLLPWFLMKKNKFRLVKEGLVLSVLLALLYVSQTAGLQYTSASNSGFITGLFVLFVPVFLLIFFKEAPARGQWLAVAVALAGLWLLTGGAFQVNKGDALTLIAAVTYAAHLLATDKFVKADADPIILAFHQFWMTGLMCLGLAAVMGYPLEIRSAQSMGVIVFLAVFPTLSAFYIQMLAQKKTSPLKVSMIFSLEPVFAALFAWALGGEIFRTAAALGGGLIVAAMAISELSRLRSGPPAVGLDLSP